MITPNKPELLEFYDCGIRTGYQNPKIALAVASAETGHLKHELAVANCIYCPGYHTYSPDEKQGDVLKAEAAWNDFIRTVF